jgi:molybdopterin synthase sulfur carrier subunit
MTEMAFQGDSIDWIRGLQAGFLIHIVYICHKKVDLKLLYFGVSRDYAAKDAEKLTVREGLQVQDLREELKQKYPLLEDIRNFALAVNEAYAEEDLQLKEGDTVAVIPPVSGG